MPRDFSEDTEPERHSEIDEIEEQVEVNETQRVAEEIGSDDSREIERQERAREIAEESARELRELDEEAERIRRAEEIAREAAKELEGFEEDLGHSLEDAREDLQDEFVNDMESKLEEKSVKETSSDSEESSVGSESEERPASAETYVDGGDGTVYVVEMGEGADSSSEVEIEKSPEQAPGDAFEVRENNEQQVEDIEQDESVKVRNSINKTENEVHEEAEGTAEETPERSVEETPENEYQVEESTVDESKKEYAEQQPVKEPQEIEKSEQQESQGNTEDEIEEQQEPRPRSDYVTEEFQDHIDSLIEEHAYESEQEEIEEPILIEFPEEASIEQDDSPEYSIEVPDDFEELIEELVEDLFPEQESEEEQEVDEPIIIVDAMTGREHIDRTYEQRPWFPESDEEVEEEEQIDVEEQVEKLFGEVSEEEREKLKESVRSKMKTEEDLEALLEKHPANRASPDFKENYEKAREYIRKGQRGKVPRLIRELLKDEVKRIWTEFVMGRVFLALGRRLKSKTKVTQKAKKSQRKTGYHRGRSRTIKLHQPMIGKSRVASFLRFEKWLRKNYPGLCERSDYPELIDKIRKFFELRKALQGRKEIKQHELDNIAKSIGLAMSTGRDWVYVGQVPHLFKIINSSLSKKEGLRLRKVILKRMNGVRSWAELESELQRIYPDGAYKRIPEYKEKEMRTKEFFAFLDELVKGGTKKGIARRSGISKRRVRAFSDGQLPWLVRHVLSKTGKLRASKRYKSHLSSIYKVKLKALKVRGQVLASFSEFKKLVDREFPWLKERADYESLMKTMRAYFDARAKFGKQKHVTRKEIVEFASKYDISYQAVVEWFVGTSLPMVVDMLDRSLSVSEAKKELERILAMLNGVTSLKEYKKRMRTCYIGNLVKNLKSYKKDYAQVKEFFRFLKALEKGGLYTDIIGRGKLKMATTKRRLLYNNYPRLIGIAMSIPSDPPKRGHRWIPLKINAKGKPERFIQVPISINNVRDLLKVVEQLKPLKGEKMKAWKKRFGSIPRGIAFMYLLGALVSDGSFNRRNTTSTSVSISLSTKYVWSETFGEAFCYYLGMFGFKTKRYKNVTSLNQAGEEIEKMNWKSSASPIMMWIRNTLLGLKTNKSKSNQPLSAKWILKFPTELIISFLQGIADGDGYATVRSITAGIGTKHNKEFFRKILNIFGIYTVEGGTAIIITRKKSLQIAANLPLFRYADGRLFRLREIIEMIASMRYSKVTTEERKQILKYYKQGIKINQIGSLLYLDFGRNRRSSTVKKVLKDAGL